LDASSLRLGSEPDPAAAAAPGEADGAADSIHAAASPARPRSLLVVDDSRFVRASLVRGLAPRFPLQQADSGERAWELLLLDDSIGAVLSDLSMPGMDGFALLQRVRGSMLDRVRDLPFVVLSGADDAGQRSRARELGADRFAVKGAGMDELVEWLDRRLRDRPASEAHAGTTERGEGPSAPTDEPAVPVDTLAASADEAPATADAPAASADEAPPPADEPAATAGPSAPALQAAPVPQSTAADSPAPGPMPRLVPDPLPRWFQAATGRHAAGDAAPVLLRLYAPGLDDLPARLRRGVRSADALHVDGPDTAWLCVPATGPVALRLALRFGLLAAGRPAGTSGLPGARVTICLHAVDPQRPGAALAALQSEGADLPGGAGLSIRAFAGAWGPGWDANLPWPAVRMLVA
jgi:DNA-binding NarL/FixJ family response regulator